MNVHHLWNAARLLLRNMNAEATSAPEPARLTTAQGTEYDLYQPRCKPQRTVLLVYGMTIAGEKETRLKRFARALASSGFQVVVPSLPGLKAYTFDYGDLDRLANLIVSLGKVNENRLGIVAFSAGASISLAVASRPELADLVDILILFSPYATLQNAWGRLRSQALAEPVSSADWDHFIWRQCVLAYLQREHMGFTDQERSDLEHLLADYCTVVTPKEKRAYYFNVLRNRKMEWENLKSMDPRMWADFSPQGKLVSVKGRVMILHDPHDLWAPPRDSEEIIAELRQRGLPAAQRLLVTPLISHVTPRYILRLADIYRAVSMVGELYP